MTLHSFETKVYYYDTDCYNMVWHGAYVKWFEIGRVEYFRLVGVDFQKLNDDNILLPMVNLNVRYKSPARLEDILVITTELESPPAISVKFRHNVINKKDNRILVTANTEVVATSREGKLFRRLPEYISSKFNK